MKRDAFLSSSGTGARLGDCPVFSREPTTQTESGLSWLDHLQLLAAKHSHLGIASDLAGMTHVELWGVYRFLSRVELNRVAA